MAKNELRHYETTFILFTDIDESDKNTILERVQKIIEDAGGETLRVDEWGQRKLAYELKKQGRGYYIYIRYTCPGATIEELETLLRQREEVIRFLTIKVDVAFEKEQEEARERLEQRQAAGAAYSDDDDDDDDDDDFDDED
jgi:small subunit ribosomal protein S6